MKTYIISEDYLVDIANAIRDKTGSSDTMEVTEMPEQINGITTSELNFEVVGGTSAPSNPKENTIWVNTDTEVAGWEFSASEPENPAEGMVWFSTAASSPVGFNALQKNAVMVYPVGAKQYVGGEWLDKTAQTYQSGAWVEWWNGVLYDYGDQYEHITGGWVSGQTESSHTTSGGKLTVNADNLSFTNVSGGSFGVYPSKAVNLTGFTTLHVITTGSARVRIATGFPTAASNMVVISDSISGASTETAIDISAVSGSYKIAVCNRASEGSVKLYRAWLT